VVAYERRLPGLVREGAGQMRNRRSLLGRLAGGVLAAGLLLATAGMTAEGATYGPGPLGTRGKPCRVSQSSLETELATRQAFLTTLVGDVGTALNDNDLAVAHAATLGARLSTDTTLIGALAAKVPTDTTCAELIRDSRAMYALHVYDVMEPQVLLTIEADTETATETSLAAQFPALKAEIANLPFGKKRSETNKLFKLIKVEVFTASKQSGGIAARVLATKASGWPSNKGVFVSASAHLTAGQIDLAAAQNTLTALNELLA
jgi:hypothetical protein